MAKFCALTDSLSCSLLLFCIQIAVLVKIMQTHLKKKEEYSRLQGKSKKSPPNLPLTLVRRQHCFRHPVYIQRKRLLVRNGIIPDELFVNNNVKFNAI